MKKLFLSSAILIFSISAIAQTNTFPSAGNVGVGTTIPSTQLEVKGITKTDTLLCKLPLIENIVF